MKENVLPNTRNYETTPVSRTPLHNATFGREANVLPSSKDYEDPHNILSSYKRLDTEEKQRRYRLEQVILEKYMTPKVRQEAPVSAVVDALIPRPPLYVVDSLNEEDIA